MGGSSGQHSVRPCTTVLLRMDWVTPGQWAVWGVIVMWRPLGSKEAAWGFLGLLHFQMNLLSPYRAPKFPSPPPFRCAVSASSRSIDARSVLHKPLSQKAALMRIPLLGR